MAGSSGAGVLLGLLLAMIAVSGVRAASPQTIVSDFIFSYDAMFPSGFWCPDMNVTALGIKNDGSANVAPVWKTSNGFLQGTGIFFMPAGTYRVASDLTIEKPIFAEEGAVFLVEKGVRLTIDQAASHPPSLFFSGQGTTIFANAKAFNPAIPVEWFGAKGDGVTDDAPAIQRTIDAAGMQGVVFSGKTYVLGSPISKPTNMRFMTQPGAVLKAATPRSTTGVICEQGTPSRFVQQLPALQGFRVGLQAAGLVHISVPSIDDCDDAIRLRHDGEKGNNVGVYIDADRVTNVKRVVVFSTAQNYAPPKLTLMQGNEVNITYVEMGSFQAGSASQALVHFEGPFRADWDSSTLMFGTVDATKAAGNSFAVLRCDGGKEGACRTVMRENIIIYKELKQLPRDAKLVDGWTAESQFKLALAAPFTPPQLQMDSVFHNNFIFTDLNKGVANRVPMLPTLPKDVTKSNQARFNGGTPLHSTVVTLRIPPQKGIWRRGQKKHFYLYHQLAQKGEQFYLAQPDNGGGCFGPGVAMVALFDNSKNKNNEIFLTLMACKKLTAAKTRNIRFKLLVGSVGL